MNPVAKEKWLEALRSGRFVQGQEKLNRNGKFCCLGVLCEVAIEEGLPVEVSQTTVTAYDGQIAWLPPRVSEWAGIDPGGSRRSGPSLFSLNDAGSTFSEIADIIEAEF